MSIERLREIVNLAVLVLFQQIDGGRLACQNEATLQLHLGRIIATVGDLKVAGERETFSIELEKPRLTQDEQRGRIDIWFCLTGGAEGKLRCAIELKFFKKANRREPNNRYDVFKDIARLEKCGDIANLAFMLVATDHSHYISQESYSKDTADFDFRDGKSYQAGKELVYRTNGYGPPIKLRQNYQFRWSDKDKELSYLLLEIQPTYPSCT